MNKQSKITQNCQQSFGQRTVEGRASATLQHGSPRRPPVSLPLPLSPRRNSPGGRVRMRHRGLHLDLRHGPQRPLQRLDDVIPRRQGAHRCGTSHVLRRHAGWRWVQVRKSPIHIQIQRHPRRRNVAAQVAGELKTVTYATRWRNAKKKAPPQKSHKKTTLH